MATKPKRPCADCGCPIIHAGGILHFEDCEQHEVGDCTICEHQDNKAEAERLRLETDAMIVEGVTLKTEVERLRDVNKKLRASKDSERWPTLKKLGWDLDWLNKYMDRKR